VILNIKDLSKANILSMMFLAFLGVLGLLGRDPNEDVLSLVHATL
jgi:hypothetical protein